MCVMFRCPHTFGHTVYAWPLAWPATSCMAGNLSHGRQLQIDDSEIYSQFKSPPPQKKKKQKNVKLNCLPFSTFSSPLYFSVSTRAVFLNFFAVSFPLICPFSLSWVKKRAGSISVIHGLDRGWVLLQVDKKISSFCCCLHALCTLSLICDVLLCTE